MVAALKKLFPKGAKGVGIELTPERINIVQLRKQKQVLKLDALTSIAVPAGIFQEGRVVDPAAMAELIRSGLEEKKIKAKQAASAVSLGEAIVRLLPPVPAEMDERELWDHVNQEAGLYLPFAREEADVDFQKLSTFIDEDGIERLNILLVATPREVTDSYLETFSQAGLTLSILEVSSFALIRTIREQLLQFSPQDVVAIADIEFDSTEISIVMDGIPQFTRRVPIGTAQLQSAVSRAMNLPGAMGVDLLHGMRVPLAIDDTATSINPGATAILRIFGELADELRRSIDFYLNQGEGMEVVQVFLAGPGAGIGQLDEFFSQRLNLTTTQIDPVKALALEVPEEIPQVQRPGLGVVIGLGLREA